VTVEMFSIMGAAAAICIGVLGPALAAGMAVRGAMDAIARQPEAGGSIGRNFSIGLAIIEAMAIYCFVVALLLLYANPYTAAG
jgi:F-type H+-transporting ATPase subunit c